MSVTVVHINTSPDMHPDPVCEILYTDPDPLSGSVRGCPLVRRTSSRITFTHGRVRLHVLSGDTSATPRRPVRKRRDPRHRQQVKVIRYLPPSQLATPPPVGSTVDVSTSTADDQLITSVCDGAGNPAAVEDSAATRLLPPATDSGSLIPAAAPPSSEYRLSLSELYQNGLFVAPSDVIKQSGGGCRLTALSRPSRRGVDSPDSGLEASEEELVASPQPASCGALQCDEAAGLQEVSEQLDRDQEFIIVVSETVPLRQEDGEDRVVGRLTEFPGTKDTVFSDSEDSVFSWGTSVLSSKVPTSSSDSQEGSVFPWDHQTATKDLLCPLTRENVHLLNAHSEKVRLQLPRSLLELHALLLLDKDMRGAAGPAADLYTVLGGTVRGYPASWHRLGTRYDEDSTSSDLQPPAESLLSGGGGSTTSQELPQQTTSSSSTSSIEDWTLGRRRGQTSRSRPPNDAGLSGQLALNQRRHQKDNLVEDSEEDDWYPVCARCKETVYPQDSVRPCLSTVYHRVCLRCCKCDLTIGHAEVRFSGRLIYCPEHAPNGSSLANVHLDTDRLKPFSRPQLPEFGRMRSKP